MSNNKKLTPIQYDRQAQLAEKRNVRQKKSTKRRHKIDNRLSKNALVRLAYLVPRDILLMITDAAGWHRGDERIAILMSLRDSKEGRTIAKTGYDVRISNRIQTKTIRRNQKQKKQHTNRSPLGINAQ